MATEKKKKGYEDYKNELGKISDPVEKLKIELLLDLRFTMNNIDKILKKRAEK